MSILLSTWNTIQNTLFPFFKEVPEPLSEKEQQFVQAVTLMNVQQYACNYKWKGIGRKPADRISLLKAFIAEAVHNFETTEFLIEHLRKAENLRRLCGWEYSFRVPSAPAFSRAFEQFSADKLGVKIHEATVTDNCGPGSQVMFPLIRQKSMPVKNRQRKKKKSRSRKKTGKTAKR